MQWERDCLKGNGAEHTIRPLPFQPLHMHTYTLHMYPTHPCHTHKYINKKENNIQESNFFSHVHLWETWLIFSLLISSLICGMRRVICLSADRCVAPDFRSLAVAEGSDSVDTGVTLVALRPWESPSVCGLCGVVCCWVSSPCLAQLEVQDYVQFYHNQSLSYARPSWGPK